jgi:hypothetical protein
MNKQFIPALVAGAIALGLLAGSCSSVRKSVRTEKHLVDSTVQEQTSQTLTSTDSSFTIARLDSTWTSGAAKQNFDAVVISLDPDKAKPDSSGFITIDLGDKPFADSATMVGVIGPPWSSKIKVPANTKSVEIRHKQSQEETKGGALTRSNTIGFVRNEKDTSSSTKRTDLKKTDEVKTKDKKRTGVSAGFWITGGAILALGLLFLYWRRRRQQSKPFFNIKP